MAEVMGFVQRKVCRRFSNITRKSLRLYTIELPLLQGSRLSMDPCLGGYLVASQRVSDMSGQTNEDGSSVLFSPPCAAGRGTGMAGGKMAFVMLRNSEERHRTSDVNQGWCPKAGNWCSQRQFKGVQLRRRNICWGDKYSCGVSTWVTGVIDSRC